MDDPTVEVRPSGVCVIRWRGEDVSARPADLPARARADVLAELAAHRAVLGDDEGGPGAWIRACFPALSAASSGVRDLGFAVPADVVEACRRPTWASAVRVVAPHASRRVVRLAAQRFGQDAANPCAYAIFPVLALLDALLGRRPDRMVSTLQRTSIDHHGLMVTGLGTADAHLLAAVVGRGDLDRAQRLAGEALRQPRRWAAVVAVLRELGPDSLAELNAGCHGRLAPLWEDADRAWYAERRSLPLARPPLPPRGVHGRVLRTATTPWELDRWGVLLDNCMSGGYARRLRGGHLVVGMFADDDAPEVLVEIVDGRIAQLLGHGNEVPDVREVAAVHSLLRGSGLLGAGAEQRLAPDGVLVPLLALLRGQVGFADADEESRAAELLWCLGWLGEADARPHEVLALLRRSGPITPPRPLATADAIGLRFPDPDVRRRLLRLLHGEAVDPRQLVLAA